mmetsp:Transcript_21521/g.61561  ORF Transcript_21521/g.61561 Transcript_21521/m.61561 type:complete len:225 (-) Transcript_21521:3759-4433(-)
MPVAGPVRCAGQVVEAEVCLCEFRRAALHAIPDEASGHPFRRGPKPCACGGPRAAPWLRPPPLRACGRGFFHDLEDAGGGGQISKGGEGGDRLRRRARHHAGPGPHLCRRGRREQPSRIGHGDPCAGARGRRGQLGVPGGRHFGEGYQERFPRRGRCRSGQRGGVGYGRRGGRSEGVGASGACGCQGRPLPPDCPPLRGGRRSLRGLRLLDLGLRGPPGGRHDA